MTHEDQIKDDPHVDTESPIDALKGDLVAEGLDRDGLDDITEVQVRKLHATICGPKHRSNSTNPNRLQGEPTPAAPHSGGVFAHPQEEADAIMREHRAKRRVENAGRELREAGKTLGGDAERISRRANASIDDDGESGAEKLRPDNWTVHGEIRDDPVRANDRGRGGVAGTGPPGGSGDSTASEHVINQRARQQKIRQNARKGTAEYANEARERKEAAQRLRGGQGNPRTSTLSERVDDGDE